MKKNLIGLTAFIFTICAFHTARAQYPRVPPAMQHKADSAMDIEKKRSDSVFASVMPIIEKEAKEGKPYILGSKAV
jgi:hypothetical protein